MAQPKFLACRPLLSWVRQCSVDARARDACFDQWHRVGESWINWTPKIKKWKFFINKQVNYAIFTRNGGRHFAWHFRHATMSRSSELTLLAWSEVHHSPSHSLKSAAGPAGNSGDHDLSHSAASTSHVRADRSISLVRWSRTQQMRRLVPPRLGCCSRRIVWVTIVADICEKNRRRTRWNSTDSALTVSTFSDS